MDIKKQLVFFKKLKKAVKSGLPLDNFFSRLAKNSMWPHTKTIYYNISEDIQKGVSLAGALSSKDDIVNKLYISLINAGEKSGKLDDILDNIITIIENEIFIQKKLTSELRMPFINIFGALFIFGIVLFALIPAIMGFMENFASCPPILVKLIYFFQQVFLSKELFFFIGIVVLISVGADFYKSEIADFSDYFGYRAIKAPFFGHLIRWAELYIYFLVLKTCYSAGLSIVESTELAGSTVKNHYIRHFTDEIYERTKNGEVLSGILSDFEDEKVIENEVTELIEIGETTGKMEESLNDAISLLKEYINDKIQLICNVTPFLGMALAAAPLIVIVIIILSVLAKAAGTVMEALSGIGL